ncbi:HAMP domain-containing histidine kinase [Saccharopolyspora sp. 6V]|nr:MULTISPECIES: MtrAB system histidine kinase MtrB [unclassified Saccharopolyspora]MCA1188689.1 HAMP domain-containing histidine kinase [Saccharopolyspora sp. 6T]MCA1195027.1 HAMP domain-containing histidine kinase [Saccharopolyspora sp. 6V]MCA1227676.1 HAMP domain-containing histidine kinase [Saccharopolyspora sp. 6M]MCA1279246.1 HAMP domain-containing histidine kinase [Saccharopolyspora sp. 7B]
MWRRSMQLRVVVSTLALSSVVICVLGMVLQTQITYQLMTAKEDAAISQVRYSLPVLERELTAVDPNSDDVSQQLEQALNRLTTPNSGRPSTEASAGAFDPVLVDGSDAESEAQPSAGPIDDVPEELRRFVEQGELAKQITTVQRGPEPVTMLVVGTPVDSSTRSLQAYLLFPLTSEKDTLNVVQSTLLVGGLVLVVLLGAITNLVTRQVVRPVRQAAENAARLADGDLDQRMRVIGEDDVARLAESFNEMADSLKQQIKQLEEFGQLQRRFTSDVSHELRTPLTTVRMAADVLHASREQFPPGLARSTELLVDELDRFESLLADLLEISRLDAGVAELSAEPLDLPAIVQRAVDSVRGIAETSGVPLRVEVPAVDLDLVADARRVERIVRNLIANAIDHAEGGPVEVRFGAGQDAVAVSIRDYGVGLRPGEAELVFTRFWRADPSRNRRTGGTGLGLSISSEDARLHGGVLDAWGEPGSGSCFRLTLPREPGREFGESPLALPSGRRIAAPGALLARTVDAHADGEPDGEPAVRDTGPARLSEPAPAEPPPHARPARARLEPGRSDRAGEQVAERGGEDPR